MKVSLPPKPLLSGLAILINHPPPSQKRTRHSTNPSPRERITIFTHFSRVNTDEHPSFAASAVSLSPDGSWAMPYNRCRGGDGADCPRETALEIYGGVGGCLSIELKLNVCTYCYCLSIHATCCFFGTCYVAWGFGWMMAVNGWKVR